MSGKSCLTVNGYAYAHAYAYEFVINLIRSPKNLLESAFILSIKPPT
jgi:hypothetical protein